MIANTAERPLAATSQELFAPTGDPPGGLLGLAGQQIQRLAPQQPHDHPLFAGLLTLPWVGDARFTAVVAGRARRVTASISAAGLWKP
jgi:hypothetical protein